MKNIKTIVIISIVVLFTIIYNIYDKNRIKIVEQKIKNLLEYFNNFTNLQITDLYGKYFGKNPKKLIEKINSINYDIIDITGDVKNKNEDIILMPF